MKVSFPTLGGLKQNLLISGSKIKETKYFSGANNYKMFGFGEQCFDLSMDYQLLSLSDFIKHLI